MICVSTVQYGCNFVIFCQVIWNFSFLTVFVANTTSFSQYSHFTFRYSHALKCSLEWQRTTFIPHCEWAQLITSHSQTPKCPWFRKKLSNNKSLFFIWASTKGWCKKERNTMYTRIPYYPFRILHRVPIVRHVRGDLILPLSCSFKRQLGTFLYVDARTLLCFFDLLF